MDGSKAFARRLMGHSAYGLASPLDDRVGPHALLPFARGRLRRLRV